MKILDNYDNLKALYKKSRKKLHIALIVFAIVFVLSGLCVLLDLDSSIFYLSATAMFISLPTVLVLGIVALVYKLTSASIFRKFTDEELSRINEDLVGAPEFKGFIITRDSLIYSKTGFTIIPLRDVLWIYKQITTHRTNGIPTGKSYSAIIALKNKKTKFFATNKKDDLMEFLRQEISKYRKGVFFGYSDQLHEMYNMYTDRMIQMSDEAER